MIPMTECQSSHIAAHGYDAETRTLAIRFHGGERVYHYRDVPPETAQGLAKAGSVGRFFIAHIKGQFEVRSDPAEPQGGGGEDGAAT